MSIVSASEALQGAIDHEKILLIELGSRVLAELQTQSLGQNVRPRELIESNPGMLTAAAASGDWSLRAVVELGCGDTDCVLVPHLATYMEAVSQNMSVPHAIARTFGVDEAVA